VHAIGPGWCAGDTADERCDLPAVRLRRGRELHLELGMRALKTRTAAGKVQPRAMDGFMRLIEQNILWWTGTRWRLARGDGAVDGAGCLVG